MHLARGLEFRAVVVMACDVKIIPLAVTIEALSSTEADRNAIKKLCIGTRLEFRNHGKYARIKAGMVKSIEEILQQFELTYNEIIKAQRIRIDCESAAIHDLSLFVRRPPLNTRESIPCYPEIHWHPIF